LNDGMSTTTFSVPGMTCGHCKQAVTSELTKIVGVTSVDVDLDTKQVVVASESPVEWKAIVDAVDEAGFEAVNG
jgi:copper ion binding protein